MDSSPSHFADTPSTPALRAIAVVPGDATVLPFLPKALYVGTGGTIVMRASADQADSVWHNVPDGAILPVRASAVRATGTTATDILALG